MKTYIKRLKSHPGVPMMCAITPALILAGISNENISFIGGVIIGFLASMPFWLVVLITARTQPIDSKYLDKGASK